MTAANERPAGRLWERSEMERRAVRAVQAAEWQRRMLTAGGIDAEQLSEQGRRILGWLAEWDDWTVDGLAELLRAASVAGADPCGQGPGPVAEGRVNGAGDEDLPARSSALDLLRALSAAAPGTARWRQWIVAVDAVGRITLPAETRPIVDPPAALRAVGRDRALVLRRDGVGTARQLDGRGRLTLPGWLRRLVGPEGAVLVAASVPDASTVVVAPAAVLDFVIEGLAGEVA